MGGPQHDEVARAVAVAAVKARAEADTCAAMLREKPFWRFRRRQQLGRALAHAREQEQEALRLLNEL